MVRFFLILLFSVLTTFGEETFDPFKRSKDVPQNVENLWKEYDPRKEALEIKIIKEWETSEAVSYTHLTLPTKRIV